jgi:hypothetical protein
VSECVSASDYSVMMGSSKGEVEVGTGSQFRMLIKA